MKPPGPLWSCVSRGLPTEISGAWRGGGVAGAWLGVLVLGMGREVRQGGRTASTFHRSGRLSSWSFVPPLQAALQFTTSYLSTTLVKRLKGRVFSCALFSLL